MWCSCAAMMPRLEGHSPGLMAGPSLAPPGHGMLPDDRLGPHVSSNHLMPPPAIPSHEAALHAQPAIGPMLLALPGSMANGEPISNKHVSPVRALHGFCHCAAQWR